MSNAPTRTELDDQLENAKQRLAGAQEQLGAASLDGTGEKAVTKRVREAEEDVARIEAALVELTRREEATVRAGAEEAARKDRRDLYAWIADSFLPAVAEVVTKREALARADQNVRDLAVPNRIRNLKLNHSERIVVNGVSQRRLLSEVELDYPLLRDIPDPPRGTDAVAKGFTVDQLNELAARAKELAEAEERGEGASVTVSGAQVAAERKAQKERRRREYAEKLAAEKAEKAEAQAKRDAARTAEREARDEARRRELAGNAKARGEQLVKPERGSDVPTVMAGIEWQEAGFGDSR